MYMKSQQRVSDFTDEARPGSNAKNTVKCYKNEKKKKKKSMVPIHLSTQHQEEKKTAQAEAVEWQNNFGPRVFRLSANGRDLHPWSRLMNWHNVCCF